jgi:ferredoxin
MKRLSGSPQRHKAAKKDMSKKKIPSIDLSRCTGCDSCIEVCPAVFKRNEETGIIEVADLSEYPDDKVQEAISICPADCITWEDE